MSRQKVVGVLTVVSFLYAVVWATVMTFGVGPGVLQEAGPLRSVGMVLFYVACVELLLSTKLRGEDPSHPSGGPSRVEASSND